MWQICSVSSRPSLTHSSGTFLEYTMEFKRIRDAHISESAAETNRLVIRLEKVDEQRERA